MRSLIGAALAAVILSTAALAQSAAPPPPKVKLEVSIETLNIIAKALGELPMREAAPILNDITQQIQPQLATPPAETPGKSKK